MAGKKDKVLVSVIGDLTNAQAAQLTKEIMKAKAKCAPNGRGTIATGEKGNVANLLQSGQKKMLGTGKGK